MKCNCGHDKEHHEPECLYLTPDVDRPLGILCPCERFEPEMTDKEDLPPTYPVYMSAFQMAVIATLLKDTISDEEKNTWKEKVVKDILDQIEKYHVQWRVLDS